MRGSLLLLVLVVLAGCTASQPATDEAASPAEGSARPPAADPLPTPVVEDGYLNETFALELMYHRNALSHTSFLQKTNCVRLDGKNVIELTGVARWSAGSELTRSLRVAVFADEVLNATTGESPLEFHFYPNPEHMAATPRKIGLTLPEDGTAVLQSADLELSARSKGSAAAVPRLQECPAS